MRIELDATIVYVSDLLAVRHPSVYDGLGRSLLALRGISLA